jgi:hypothetical protein
MKRDIMIYLDLNVFEVNVFLILIAIFFVVVNVIDYVDDVFVGDDEIVIGIVIVIVYVDDV